MRPVAVTHISTYDARGGAGIAATRLHSALRAAGLASSHLVRFKTTSDPHTYIGDVSSVGRMDDSLIASAIQAEYIDKRRTPCSNTLFSLDYPGIDVTRHPVVARSDVINLHWVGSFLSVESVGLLLRSDIPVVWTLHDQNSFTGGCHYSSGCLGYTQDCSACPQISEDPHGLIPARLRDRIDLFGTQKPIIVAPSEWMRRCASQSAVFGGAQTFTIPNSVPIVRFYPEKKTKAREYLGLDPDAPCILLAAESHKEKRKGFAGFITALKSRLADSSACPVLKRVTILCFGEPTGELTDIGLNVVSLGKIEEERLLRAAYSAADLFVMTSEEDNFPNTVLESLACGTPVLSFDIGGLPEMIRHAETGWLVPAGKFHELITSLESLLEDQSRLHRWAVAARHDVEKRFSPALQSARYKELYDNLLRDRAEMRGKSARPAYKNGAPETDLSRGPGLESVFQTVAGESLNPAYKNLVREYEQINYDRILRGDQIIALTEMVKGLEADRIAKGEQIERLTKLVHELEVDRAVRGEQIEGLTKLVLESETDRAARGKQIELLTQALRESDSCNAKLAYTVKMVSLKTFLRKCRKFVSQLQRKRILERPKNSVLRTIAVDLTPVIPGGENGGAKIFVFELLRKLAAIAPQARFILLTQSRSHEELAALDGSNMSRVMVVEPAMSGDIQSSLQKLHARMLVYIPSRWRHLVARVGYKLKARIKKGRTPSLLRGLNVDLLFCPFTAPTYSEAGIPTVCTVHDLQYKTFPSFFSVEDAAHRDQVFVDACQKASAIAAVSNYARDSIILHSEFNPSRIRTIYHRMSERAKPQAQAGQSIMERLCLVRNGYLIYPANFWMHKNHEMLLAAFGMARATGLPENIKLVCTGSPGERFEWLKRAVAGMGLSERVLFPGYLPDDELAALMGNSAGMIFPSLYEGFGLPVIEAMSAGIPVACSNAASLPEIAADSAILFDPRIPQQIADAIISLVSDVTLRDCLIQAGAKRAGEFASSERMASEYWDLFQYAFHNQKHQNLITGVFSDGWVGSSMTVQVAPDDSLQTFEIEFSAPGWLPQPELTAHIRVDGQETAIPFEIVHGVGGVFTTSLTPIGGQYEIHISPTFVPARTGHGPDERELSVLLQRCEVLRANGERVGLYPQKVSA